MKVQITEYDEKGKVLQILEYCSYAQQEIYYNNMIPAKENENGKEESRTKKQTTKQDTI